MLRHGRSGVLRGLAVMLVVFGTATFGSLGVLAQDDSITIDLVELNDSGISGTATLTADGDTTIVSVELTGAPGGQQDHIHEGYCEDVNPTPEYPLEEIDDDGAGETVVDVPLDELLAEPYSILVHLSASELGDYVACGDIVAEAVGGEDDSDEGGTVTEGVGGTTTSAVPDSGVGTLSTSDSLTLLAGLGAVVVSLTLGGIALRRRETHL